MFTNFLKPLILKFLFTFVAFTICYGYMNNGVERNHHNRDWLNSYKNSDHSWVLYSRKQNITCYSGRVLFPYGPECADQELSKDLTRSQKIPLGFNLTFMGHQFDHAFVNQHGIISFQETFLGQTISQEDWPHPKYPYVDDPVFIAPFFAQTDLAGDKIDDLTSTKYGRVLYKVLHRVDLQPIYTEEEKFIYQMSMQILEDAQGYIREAVSGAEDFRSEHAIIATWKSVAFLGNSIIDIDDKPRNTFQALIVSDNANTTYAIFNYENVEWYASTNQGGNSETGTGGKAAKIGFNRGNGSLWYGHKPFSENAQLMQSIAKYSNVQAPGRFIFRIDEWIQPGGCLEIDFNTEKNLQIWPRNGIMLGGQEVNITGPCFNDKYHFLCKWGDGYDAVVTPGEVVHLYSNLSTIKGRCVQPKLFYNGRLNLSISLDGGITFDWKSEFNIVDPLRYPPKVQMVNINEWHSQSSPPRLIIAWDRFELNYAESALVDIELWGYYEDDSGPHWDFLQMIGEKKLNKGSYGFDVAPNRAPNQTMARRYKLGAIAVALEDAFHSTEINMTKKIWTGLHPLGWWRNDEMKFFYDKNTYLFGSSRGKNWAEDQCRWWHQYRRYDLYWMDDLELCPPTLMFAIGDVGVWAPDPTCNMYGNLSNELNCLQHKGASHCVITMRRTSSGAGNRCCYDQAGNLMYTNDTMSGSTPDRYHSLGMAPFNTYGKVPGLSHYYHDIVPYYLCCHWSNLCESYLYLRQTKDAKGYKEPRMAVAYGDPHILTFDGKDYTFNGKGEFTLFKSKKYNFRLQGRFEQPPNATFCLLSSKGQINATRITAIAAGQDDSDFVEVRARIDPSQSHFRKCDVLVNGKTYYFHYGEEKVQIFKNVFVLSPLHDEFQSNITIMFNSSGIGINVECMFGLMHVRASAPYSLFKDTAGLFGYWDNITSNDFMSPDGSTNQLTMKPDLLYQRFGMAWRLRDESESIFSYSGSWSFDTFHDQRPFIKEWQRFRPWFTHGEIPFPSNVSFTQQEWEETCEGDVQCLYDAAALGSLEIGRKTKEAHQYYTLMHENMKSVNSCGIYQVKGGIRSLSKGNYLTGSIMKVSCLKGYTLFGWDEFYCNWNGTWLPTNNQWINEFRDWPYCEHYHITAIRWTSIGLSIIWTLSLISAIVYYLFFKKTNEYVTETKKTTGKKTLIPFKEPDQEMEELEVFDEKFDYKDGIIPAVKAISNFTKSVQNLNEKQEKEREKTNGNNDANQQEEINIDSTLVPTENMKKPYILLQLSNQNNDEYNERFNLKPKPFGSNKPMYINDENNLSFNTSSQHASDLSENHQRIGSINQSDIDDQVENSPKLLHQKQYSNPNLVKLMRQRERQQQGLKQHLENNRLNSSGSQQNQQAPPQNNFYSNRTNNVSQYQTDNRNFNPNY